MLEWSKQSGQLELVIDASGLATIQNAFLMAERQVFVQDQYLHVKPKKYIIR